MTSGESRLLHHDILHRYLERRDAGDLRGGLVAELAAERVAAALYGLDDLLVGRRDGVVLCLRNRSRSARFSAYAASPMHEFV